MDKLLRVLIVEDSEDDALLMEHKLKSAGYMPETCRVETGPELDAALLAKEWDIVITDHNLPGFSSDATLKRVKESGADIPVIIVSGSIGEDIAVAAMRAGAHDYIMKDNLARLVPAIERELREVESRRARKRAEAVIRHMAYHDSLTGLINRGEFERRLKRALYNFSEKAHPHALLYIDLDQFKIINDTCGHVAGDELLKQITVILHKPVRESDTLARLGGDEFGVLLENCPLEQAMQIAEKLLKEVTTFHFAWESQTFTIGASIGLVMLNDKNRTMSEVLSAADLSCYAAKDAGRNRIHLYRDDDSALIRRHGEMQWVARIHEALEKDQFLLYQQAIQSVAAGQKDAMHYEFLLRLKDKQQIIAPGAFIPAAERFNLMPRIDTWVVESAFRQISDLNKRAGLAEDTIFFINLSGASLSEANFFAHIKQQFSQYQIQGKQVCFEITETAAITYLGATVEFIKQIKQLGCKFALDDFGAGLSSFSYLKNLPVDFLKIDGAFVRDIVDDPMDRAIVAAVNNIAHVAELKTVAEFVETPEIIAVLRDIGVDYAQGYGISRPAVLDNLYQDQSSQKGGQEY